MVHPRFRFARREKVGEVGNRLKHFLNAAPSRFLAARGPRGFDEQAAAFNGVTDCYQDPNGWGDTRHRSSLGR